MMTSRTSTLPTQNLSRKSRASPREKTGHEILSDHQRAYTVFVRLPDKRLKLFQVINLRTDRLKSPRKSSVNLKEVFTMLPGVDEAIYHPGTVDAFLSHFENVEHYHETSQDPAVVNASEESLRSTGVTITTPPPRIGMGASRSRTTHIKLSLSPLSEDEYTEGSALKHFIWKHAETVFLLLLPELEMGYAQEDRSLLGVVASASAVAWMKNSVDVQTGGSASRGFHEGIREHVGRTGLHFSVFPVEHLGRHHWRVYQGIGVCDSQLDETASLKDHFYHAERWFCGTGNLNRATSDDSKIVGKDERMGSTANAKQSRASRESRQQNPDYVYVTTARRTVPFVNIDTRKFVSKFAMKQCKLAAIYRKPGGKKAGKALQAVRVLRIALRKGYFESAIRALYDLSGCYWRGIGVEEDEHTAKLLGHCASGMRRNYGTTTVWLKRLAMEIGYRRRPRAKYRYDLSAVPSQS